MFVRERLVTFHSRVHHRAVERAAELDAARPVLRGECRFHPSHVRLRHAHEPAVLHARLAALLVAKTHRARKHAASRGRNHFPSPMRNSSTSQFGMFTRSSFSILRPAISVVRRL